MPVRIQRRRTKGWQMPANTVYVGRPSMWGNNYPVGGIDHQTGTPITKPEQAVALFVERQCGNQMRADVKLCLEGYDLACWCPLVDKDGKPVPCHADVLLEIANS